MEPAAKGPVCVRCSECLEGRRGHYGGSWLLSGVREHGWKGALLLEL